MGFLTILSSSASAETLKTVFNPFTGKFDYITRLDSTTLPSGSTFYIQNTQSLQNNAVFYVSSGTIRGPFQTGGTNNYVSVSNSGMITYTGTAGPFISIDQYASRSADFVLAGEIYSSTYSAIAFTDVTGAVTFAISVINADSFSLYNMAVGTTQSNGNMLNVQGNAVITNTLSVGTTNTTTAPILFKSTSNANTDMAFALQRGGGQNIFWGTNNGFFYFSTFTLAQVANIRLQVAGGVRISSSVGDGNDFAQFTVSGLLNFTGASHYSVAGNRPVVCTAASPFGMCMWNSANTGWRLTDTNGLNSPTLEILNTGQFRVGSTANGIFSTMSATGVWQTPNTILFGGANEQSIAVAPREPGAVGGNGRGLTISAGVGSLNGISSVTGGSMALKAGPGSGTGGSGGDFQIDAGSGTTSGAIQIGTVFATTVTIGKGVSVSTFDASGNLNVALKLFTSSGAAVASASLAGDNIFQVGGGTLAVTRSGFITAAGGAITTANLSSCGITPAVATGSNNMSGKITLGTGGATACVMTFIGTWPNNRAPACVVTNETTANLFRATSTSNQVTFSGTGLGADVLSYICLGM